MGIKIVLWKKMEFLICRIEQKGEQHWDVESREGYASIQFDGSLKPQNPLFGKQPYLDADEGMRYELILPQTEGLLAVYQHKEWWIRPKFPRCVEEIPEKTQLLLGKSQKGYYAVLAVCGKTCRTDLSGEKNRVIVKVSSNAVGYQTMKDLSLVITAGENPYQCCHDAVEKALSILEKREMIREERQYPDLMEYFGWCTWDAFYHKVSQRGILDKLAEFREKKIPLGWVLIDDGWLDADYERQVLKGLDARKNAFPNGLAECVRRIREEFGIRNTGVWHAVMGYWNGLEKESKAWDALGAYTDMLPDGRILPSPEAGKAFCFFEKWHSFLKNHCGITFVKVDGQSSVSLAYTGRETYGEASAAIQKGLNASAALHFNNAVINCMGMAPQDMWNRPSSAVSRSSDDFVPQESGSFQEHVIQNGFNSLLQGQFYWGDWDMFWSSHNQAWQNSMLRAVSGGPVYVSDPPGETDPAVILPLICKDGRLIRCQFPGVPSVDCLFEDPVQSEKGLKIISRYQDASIMAVFSMRKEGCTGKIRPSDFVGKEEEYLVYRWSKGELFYMKQNGPVSYQLSGEESEIFVMMPKKGEHKIIGVLEKYIPLGGIQILSDGEKRSEILVSEPGTFAFWAGCNPSTVKADGINIQLRAGKNGLYRILNRVEKETLIEIEWGGLRNESAGN